MKTLFIVAAIFAVAQGHHGKPEEHPVVHVQRTLPEVDGAPKYNPGGRVINGIQATRGQFPYMAALYLDGSSFCGGSLISQRWVLTAAHCASGISTFTVHLGAQNLNNVSENGRLIIESSQKIVHSGYIAILLTDDIALVNLGRDVALSNFIKTINLASGSEQYVGAAARASGWGKTSDASSSVSPQMNYVDLTIISNEVCKQTFGSNIRESNICTQGVGTSGVCNGDSGSPLIDRASGQQIGIASFVSRSGCESGSPNGFVRVSSYSDWISSNTGIQMMAHQTIIWIMAYQAIRFTFGFFNM